MKKTHATILWVAVAAIVVGFLYFWVGGGNKTADLSPKALIEGAAVVEEGVPEEGGPELAAVEAVDAKRQ
jgi:hypothetical protein